MKPWVLVTHDEKVYELTEEEKLDVDNFMEIGLKVLAMPDGSSVASSAVRYVEPKSDYQRRGGEVNLSSRRDDSYYLGAPAADKRVLETFRARRQEILGSKSEPLYAVGAGEPMSFKKLYGFAQSLGYIGPQGPHFVTGFLSGKGYRVVERAGGKENGA